MSELDDLADKFKNQMEELGDTVIDIVKALRNAPIPPDNGHEEPDEPDEPEEPEPSDKDTAAARFNWGAPSWSDDFAKDGSPDSSKWENSPSGGMDGHNGNGRRIANCAYVKNGILTLEGKTNGDTGWLRQKLATQYGRWEIRSRSRNTGNTGGNYHPLHLIWPSSERWPQDGEYDWLEYTNPDAKKASAFLHYPHPNMPVQQEFAEKNCDMTQWHNFAFEWTKSGLKGWIDGEDFFSFSGGAGAGGRKNIQEMPKGSLTIQLDNFTGDGGLRPALFEVESVKFYPI